ncbi:Fir1p SCDLUD_002313 [Saccharomycodes ludwigii]|uniref:Fir1p n=1 Tax=Saccharomycodes ludwigii TaxID=36035 RepID=UPI001E8B21F0|nr:hypothetical protein SCDLUD_002313 [Saccharomycodes ludwigii]KAH3900858.1 hypothetical protein SCDLUD_002313 [Saccharomycodes ludwigii]
MQSLYGKVPSCLKSPEKLNHHSARTKSQEVRFELPIVDETKVLDDMNTDSKITNHLIDMNKQKKIDSVGNKEPYDSVQEVVYKTINNYTRDNLMNKDNSSNNNIEKQPKIIIANGDSNKELVNNTSSIITDSIPRNLLNTSNLYLHQDSPLNNFNVLIPLEINLPPQLSGTQTKTKRKSLLFDGNSYSEYQVDNSHDTSDISIPSAANNFSFELDDLANDEFLCIDKEANVNLKQQMSNMLNKKKYQTKNTTAAAAATTTTTRSDNNCSSLEILKSPSKVIDIPDLSDEQYLLKTDSYNSVNSLNRYFQDTDINASTKNSFVSDQFSILSNTTPKKYEANALNMQFKFPSPIKSDNENSFKDFDRTTDSKLLLSPPEKDQDFIKVSASPYTSKCTNLNNTSPFYNTKTSTNCNNNNFNKGHSHRRSRSVVSTHDMLSNLNSPYNTNNGNKGDITSSPLSSKRNNHSDISLLDFSTIDNRLMPDTKVSPPKRSPKRNIINNDVLEVPTLPVINVSIDCVNSNDQQQENNIMESLVPNINMKEENNNLNAIFSSNNSNTNSSLPTINDTETSVITIDSSLSNSDVNDDSIIEICENSANKDSNSSIEILSFGSTPTNTDVIPNTAINTNNPIRSENKQVRVPARKPLSTYNSFPKPLETAPDVFFDNENLKVNEFFPSTRPNFNSKANKTRDVSGDSSNSSNTTTTNNDDDNNNSNDYDSVSSFKYTQSSVSSYQNTNLNAKKANPTTKLLNNLSLLELQNSNNINTEEKSSELVRIPVKNNETFNKDYNKNTFYNSINTSPKLQLKPVQILQMCENAASEAQSIIDELSKPEEEANGEPLNYNKSSEFTTINDGGISKDLNFKKKMTVFSKILQKNINSPGLTNGINDHGSI